jgi:hypothetical protein
VFDLPEREALGIILDAIDRHLRRAWIEAFRNGRCETNIIGAGGL